MKSTVIKEFTDGGVYLPGNEYEADEKRIAELESGGFVKSAETEKPTRARKPKE